MPDVWQKLPNMKQEDIIERMLKRVQNNVKMAVHLMHLQGRVTVATNLDSVTITGGVKA